MEVHAHTHTARKKFTHYLWEFLMLFLAVFCGFLAENQREHMVEHRREKRYMQSLYSDLKKDTAYIKNYTAYLRLNYKRLDSIKNMINSHQYISDPKNFYRLAFLSRSVRYFESHNSGYEQLKSSGNLRLIRNQALADSLVDYYFTIQQGIRGQESRYLQATANVASAMWDILDSKYYINDTLKDGNPSLATSVSDNPVLGSTNKDKITKFKNLCNEKMIIVMFFRGIMIDLHEQATNLLLAVKDEYHFE